MPGLCIALKNQPRPTIEGGGVLGNQESKIDMDLPQRNLVFRTVPIVITHGCRLQISSLAIFGDLYSRETATKSDTGEFPVPNLEWRSTSRLSPH